MATSRTGSDVPATLGGAGWIDRPGSHPEEVAEGRLWTACGYRSEVAPLRAVLLAWPPSSLGLEGSPDSRLMLDRVDLTAIRAQAEAIAGAFRSRGVEVLVARPEASASPNIVFMRDTFFMTPAGAIVARMASAQRAGEERLVAAALAAAGYPVLRTVSGRATFEGADALWLDERTVVVGTGFRTSAGGAETVREALREVGADVVTVPLRPGVQHLLGTVVFLDDRLAVIHREACAAELRDLLRRHRYELIELPADAELTSRRGMNLVALAPSRVLMPAGAPAIRRRLEAAGVEVDEVEVGEYVKAGGGLGCLAGILRREGSHVHD